VLSEEITSTIGGAWGHAAKWDQKAISNWYFKPIDGGANTAYNGSEKSDGLITKPVKSLDK
jgi:hypothetical protein